MIPFFQGQVPKERDFPHSLEDSLYISLDTRQCIVCDGASESFDSRSWSEILARSFARRDDNSLDWLSNAITEFNSYWSPETLSWSKEASFHRGSFATIVAVSVDNELSSAILFAVGDSVAFLLEGLHLVDCFPYKQAIEFKQRPTLLSSSATFNTFVRDPDFLHVASRRWSLTELSRPFILLMTDALAEWAIGAAEAGNPQWKKLLSITSQRQLRKLVYAERAKGKMRVDDVTLVTIKLFEEGDAYIPNARTTDRSTTES